MNIVILAAGQGKRMRSTLPKVLHPIAGRPMLEHVLASAKALAGNHETILVLGHGSEFVQEFLSKTAFQAKTALQSEQKGTGHAVLQACEQLSDDPVTLILYGDVPLIQTQTLQQLAQLAQSGGLGLLTQNMTNPTGYGRILRNQDGDVSGIVEEKDASAEIRQITEINTGFMALPTEKLKHWLKQLKPNNVQGEYYLTDVIALAVAEGLPVYTTQASNDWETVGVNSRAQLADLERVWQLELASRLLEAGVTLLDPSRIDIRGELQCGTDVQIDIGCVFEGKVVLGSGVTVGPHCVIKDAVIDANAKIQAFSHIDQAKVGAGSVIGPYARLRPGTVLAEEVHVGNFVEIKNSDVGAHSKANHLAYVGDATIGKKVNIGAGTITCNYDGVNKHRTIIEDEAFIGSDTQLVAPVTVGKGATLGAGTTLTKDAPANQLTVTRVKQISLNWQRPTKKSK
jgi:bifunctional UDP-N-acetylglucosamine pyrophosphorylase / glucosamine-1-phosphate N-acetyltransferase